MRKEPDLLNKDIYMFYGWALKYIPILVMLAHWYGVFDFHDNPREILICIKENESCIAYLYFMTYVFPVIMLVPASYFFHLCWIWRIPFVYAFGVNAIRLYYGSFIIKNEMFDSDFILIILTCILYAYGIVKNTCSRLRIRGKATEER